MLDESRVDLGFAGSTSVGTTQDVGWREIDRALRRIARSERRLEAEKGRWLLAARDAAVHRQLGFATFAESASSTRTRSGSPAAGIRPASRSPFSITVLR